MNTGFLGPAVATVLTVYGIETEYFTPLKNLLGVATVLTVYGIETSKNLSLMYSTSELQQYLSFTVLKLIIRHVFHGLCNNR